ncbi:aspartyl protease family protein [Stenotrophomonas sp. NA06056]|uniref:aspartyl protease family protein n=1 Tax=Stenotrophomonas sp. NA06056 TaxID=2742129 RepID=UPI00158B9D41|nr:aspartyl protease family protein [Stenotrophomonas sp. NA06056]QKW56760.1 aspartyl protease family protein [Stenotrophomonas sp. NA06056]
MPANPHVLLAVAIACATSGLCYSANAAPVEIPFEQDKDHRIFVHGSINRSEPLRFLVDTGADALAISRAIVPKASVFIDDRTENTGSDGVTTLDYSTRNDVEISGLHARMGAVVVDYRNRPFDAVLGWKFFEGKVVEIDYDRQQLAVHRNLPDMSRYTRVNVRWIDNTPAIEVTIGNGNAVFKPWLALDTGSNGTIDLSYAYSSRQGLLQVFNQKIGTSRFTGSAGNVIRAMDVRVPSASIQGLVIDSAAASFSIDDDASTGDGTIGAGVLRQFNLLLDMKTGNVYLRRNQSAGEEPARK